MAPRASQGLHEGYWNMEGGRSGILRHLSMDAPSLTVLTSPSQKQNEHRKKWTEEHRKTG